MYSNQKEKFVHSFQLPWKSSALSTRMNKSREDHAKLLKPDAIPSGPPAFAVINSNVSDGECHSCQNEISPPGLKKLKLGYPAEKKEQ